jgi:hypothetical protein
LIASGGRTIDIFLPKVDAVTLARETKTTSIPVRFFNSSADASLKYEPTFRVPMTLSPETMARTLSSAASPN